MSATRFGRLSVNDPRLVSDMRNGREPRAKTVARIEAFLARESGGTGRAADAGVSLAHAIAAAGPAIRVVERRARRWRSESFAGTRHMLRLAAPVSPGLDRWLATLPDAEIAVPGHIVADLAVVETEQRGGEAHLLLEALTVED